MECWFIVLIDQFLYRDGLLFTYEECLSEYNMAVAPGNKVFGAIPSGVCSLNLSQGLMSNS